MPIFNPAPPDYQQIELSVPADFDLLQLQQLDSVRYPYLLESLATDTQTALGQFDILFAFPQQSISCHSITDAEKFQQDFLADFKQNQIPLTGKGVSTSEFLPFRGGWFCYLSYDYAQVVEPSLNLPKATERDSYNTPNVPLATFIRVPCAIIFSHQKNAYYAMCENAFSEQLTTLQADLTRLTPLPSTQSSFTSLCAVQKEEGEAKYLSGIADIKEYILSGDIFQVNLSREWQVEFSPDQPLSTLSLYQSLRKNNPAPFSASVYFDHWQILSSSPERLVKYDGEWVETRPIAGTRKRSLNLETDKALVEELISHPKERAEHIMLIDLERNDLGRICQPGTVEVNELMVVETYQHVHHIVSNIRGKLQKNLDPLAILHAVFPGGTITGCPKIRCMEIIGELEKMPRQAYTGSLGYINRDGTLDTNILIRTLQVNDQTVRFRAGAGIVADSIADKELEESRHKAKGLIHALGAR